MMKAKKSLTVLLLMLLTLCSLMTALLCSVIPATADEAEGAYVPAKYVVDFSNPDNVSKCSGQYHVVTSYENGAMKVTFTDSGNGICDDPYFNLALPAESVQITDAHYIALLVKTDKQDLKGELRFRTSSTGENYPCQRISYADTDDWQVIVCDLTDKNTVIYAPAGLTFSGALTNIRLDPFNNTCTPDTEYYIQAYGLYDNREDAETFLYYTPTGEETEEETQTPLPDIDYTSFWRGEAYATPAMDMRMRLLTYGFNSAYVNEVDRIHSLGYGGLVSNVNFNRQYLKDEKEFSLLRDVYRYADEKDMAVWIYDEYQWPSGKAFGQVLEGHDEYEATGIQHKVLTGSGGTVTYTLEGREIEVMEAILTDGSGSRTLPLENNTFAPVQAKGAWTLHIYVLQYTYEGEEDRNDFTKLRHVDVLNKDAVARFITLTHEKYKTAFGDDFDMVEAFFTDEPGLGNRDREDYAVWTPGLDEKFKAAYGYELPIHSIFSGDSDEDKLARMQYYALVSALFKEAYIDQISAWCEANGTASSGHLLFEENMNDQVETYGGNFLQIIGGMTIPGADILWVDPNHLMSNANIGSYMGLRYVTSGARNAGKTEVMLEYNPVAVETPEFVADAMGSSIGGITVTRLMGTTIYNVINPQNSYTTAELNTLNTYVGRLNTLLDGTTESGDVGLFYPIATIQALHDADSVHSSAYGNDTEADRLNDDYAELCGRLLTSQIMYTVLDDESICAATVTATGRLKVGNGAYRVIILAYAQYISAEAAEKLAAFCEAGGTVIFMGDPPTHSLDGKTDDRVVAAMSAMADQPAYKRSTTAFLKTVFEKCNNILSLDASTGIRRNSLLYGDFADEGHDISYLANIASISGKLTLSFRDGYDGAYTVYYPNSGLIEHGEGNTLTVTVPAYEAVLIMREDDNTKEPEIPADTMSPTDIDTQATPSDETEPTSSDSDVTTDASRGCASSVTLSTAAGICVLLGVAWLDTARRRKEKEN